MNGLVAWFTRNAVAANLLMIIAFAGGVLGFGLGRLERRLSARH
jgi:hypothetical protein